MASGLVLMLTTYKIDVSAEAISFLDVNILGASIAACWVAVEPIKT